MPRKKAAIKPVAAGRDPSTLYLSEDKELTRAQTIAREVMDGDSFNAITALMFTRPGLGKEEVDITEAIATLRRHIGQVRGGDLGQVEAMLYGQATALTAIFHECTRRSFINMGEYPEAMERYMRLALKAQSQCRTTLEALVEAKAPRSVSFVKQANIANNQQVNNGCDTAHGQPATAPNELQEGRHGRLAPGTPPACIGTDTAAATVVEIDRAAVARRKGQV